MTNYLLFFLVSLFAVFCTSHLDSCGNLDDHARHINNYMKDVSQELPRIYWEFHPDKFPKLLSPGILERKIHVEECKYLEQTTIPLLVENKDKMCKKLKLSAQDLSLNIGKMRSNEINKRHTAYSMLSTWCDEPIMYPSDTLKQIKSSKERSELDRFWMQIVFLLCVYCIYNLYIWRLIFILLAFGLFQDWRMI